MKKISILGILAIISTPAMAESVPDNGVMWEGNTYTESCNNTTLGTYTGPANMTAMYEVNTYYCAAGQYLVVGDENTEPQCETCPAGSYCPGVNGITYADNMTDVGINKCPSEYPNSYDFSGSVDSCYTSCALNQVPHATSVSGESYADGTNTCIPTGCEAGWHVKAGTPYLKSLIGVTQAANGYTANTSEGDENTSRHMSNSIIAGDPMAYAVDYGADKGIVKGHGRCSTRNVAKNWATIGQGIFASDHFVSSLEDETGKAGAQYCYCNLESYTVNGQSQALSSLWVFASVRVDDDNCAYSCASTCGNLSTLGKSSGGLRTAMFDSLVASPTMCEANTINLKWDGVTDAGDAATCSYSGDLKTPATAPVKKGYTFTGWRVNK